MLSNLCDFVDHNCKEEWVLVNLGDFGGRTMNVPSPSERHRIATNQPLHIREHLQHQTSSGKNHQMIRHPHFYRSLKVSIDELGFLFWT